MLPDGVRILFITPAIIPTYTSMSTGNGSVQYQQNGVGRVEIYGLGSDNIVYKLNSGGQWQRFTY